MIKNFLSHKTVFSYLLLVAAVLGVVASIMSIVNPGFPYGNLDLSFSISAIVAAVISIVAFILNFSFIAPISIVAYAWSFGRIIYSGAAVVADKANGISYVGGDFNSIVLYIVLIGLASVMTMIVCFNKTSK